MRRWFSCSRIKTITVPDILNKYPSLEVWIPSNEAEFDEWIHKERIFEKKGCVIGFDVEWKPSFSQIVYNKIGLIQLATDKSVALLQMTKLQNEISKFLIKLISSENIVKTGVGVFEDLKRLESDYNIPFGAFQDLGAATKRFSKFNHDGLSLAKLTKHYLGVTVSKSKHTRLSDWGRQTLSSDQIKYAAYDAYLGRHIYDKLLQEGAFEIDQMDAALTAIKLQLNPGSRTQLRKAYFQSLESDQLFKQVSQLLLEENLSAHYCEDDTLNKRQQLSNYLSRLGLKPQFVARVLMSGRVQVEVVVENRVIAFATRESKAAAGDVAAMIALAEYFDVQSRVTSQQLLKVFAGKDETSTEFVSFLNSKPLYIGPTLPESPSVSFGRAISISRYVDSISDSDTDPDSNIITAL